jgi:amino acid transporter
MGEASLQTTLRRGVIGTTAATYQAITTAAPAQSIATGAVFVVALAGGSAPLAMIIATVACALVAISIGQMARHIPSAGGMYAYVAQGFGKHIAFLLAWVLMLGYPMVVPLVALVFGYILGGYLTVHFGAPDWLWAPIVAVVTLAVWFVTYRGIRVSVRVAVAMGTIEMVIFLALAITLIVAAGGQNSASVFAPNTANPNGWGSVFAGTIYAVLAFIGFDAAANVAEETKNPKRAIPIALVVGVLALGFIFTLTTYAGVVYFGISKVANPTTGFLAVNGGDPWDLMASKVWGIAAGVLVLLAVLNSSFASNTGATNASARIGFALGRVGAFPKVLGMVHPRFRSPYIAIAAQSVISLAVALALGFALGGPVQAFGFLGVLITLLFVPVYMIASLSCLTFYWRRHRDEFNFLLHLVVPVASVVVFAPVLLASLGINFANLGIAPLTGVSAAAPWISLIWLALGAAAMIWLQTTKSPGLDRLGDVFSAEEDIAHPSAA